MRRIIEDEHYRKKLEEFDRTSFGFTLSKGMRDEAERLLRTKSVAEVVAIIKQMDAQRQPASAQPADEPGTDFGRPE